MSKQKGSITVEATIVMPFYIILMLFLANFLNVFYMRQVVQFGLNNVGSVLAQYCYVVDKTVGIQNFSISEETQGRVNALSQSVQDVSSSAGNMFNILGSGINLGNLGELINSGQNFAGSVSNFGTRLRAMRGSDLVSYLFASAGEAGGGMLVEAMMNSYLEQMRVNTNLLDGDIRYALYLDSSGGRYDLILKAAYCYKDPMFSVFTQGFVVEQQVVVHPWIGGTTEGLRGRMLGG